MKKARICSISFSGRGDLDKSRRALVNLVKQASFSEPDLIVLPETCVTCGLRNDVRTIEQFAEVTKQAVKAAEPVPGPTTEALAAECRKCHIYIICPLYQRKSDNTIHNSAILIGPEGNILGEYHKKHPVIDEIENGVRPGQDTPVFETRFGKIGMAICYDLNFRDVISGLSERGVEIVFFPTAYEGGRQLQIWAFDFGVYVVSSHSGGYSTFVDVSGRIISRTNPGYNPILTEKLNPGYNPIVTEDLNLDRKIFSLDYNWKKLDRVRKKYGKGIKIDIFVPESIFVLESCIFDLTVEDIAREFDLEYRKDYFERANQVCEKALEKR